jgi:hypothetical protein
MKRILKNQFALLMAGIVCLLLTIGLFAPLFIPPLDVHAQVTPTSGGTITTTSPLSSNTTYTVNSTAVAARKDRGLGILASFTPATTTNAVTLNFQVSNDGTNWAAATPYTLTVNLTAATTNYIAFTNFPASTFNNVAYWRLGTITTALTNAITNSISWSVNN